MSARQVPAKLPVWEQGIYWVIETFTVIYMLFSLYNASEEAWRRNEVININEGWAILGRPRDTADVEWEFWHVVFWNVLPWLCGHVLLSQTLMFFRKSQVTRQLCLSVFGVIAVSYLQGFFTLLFMCVHPLLLYFVSKLNSPKAVWATTALFLTILNCFEQEMADWLQGKMTVSKEEFGTWFYFTLVVWCNCCQRVTAFALECVWTRQTLEERKSTSQLRKTKRDVDTVNGMKLSEDLGENSIPEKDSEGIASRRIDSADNSTSKKKLRSKSEDTISEENPREKNNLNKPLSKRDPSENVTSGTQSVRSEVHENEQSGNGIPQQNSITWPVLDEEPGFLDLCYYTFYFPLYFTGPLIVYNKFHLQDKHPVPCTMARVKDIVLRLARVWFWAVLNMVTLHYIYPHAINSNAEVLDKQSRWTIAAIGYILGQFFMVKYVVLFGLPAQIARLDGFEPPTVPACISYIYCYSDMWSSFDRGLYDFMKRYIFIPMGGSRSGLVRQFYSSMLCFVYVYYWHGAEYFVFLWCVLNFIETSLEQVGAWMERTSIVKRVLYNRLSPAGVRRVRAIASVPVFLMSVFAIFYFFGGTDSGMVFFQKLLITIPWESFALFVTLVYCAMQNAMEVERLGLANLKFPPKQD